MRPQRTSSKRLAAAAAFSIALAAATPILRADLSADQTPFHSFRAIWLDRFDYSSAASIATAMQNSKNLGITDVIFQVRGNANAYYNSAYEHREMASYDPLQTAITEAHNRGLKLHAWINTMPLWLGATAPTGSDYLINQHPEYWISDTNNNTQPLNSSYVIVNPTMPEVQTHIENVVRDIAGKYQIDGLHLDYTRLTNNSNGVNLTYPMDPATVARFQQAFPGQTPAANQANYKAWVAGQITTLVGGIRDALKSTRPNAQLTAAVWRDADIGLSDYQQDWNTWIDQGLLDAAMPMIYRKGFGAGGTNMDVDSGDLYRLNVTEALDRRGNSGIIAGMGTYMQNNPLTAYNNTLAQLNYAKAQGTNGIVMFDYGTLFNSPVDNPNTPADEGVLRRAQLEVQRAFTDFYATNSTPPPPTSLTNFDTDEGYFPTNITFSGSNQNVAASSSADRITTESHSGVGSQQLIINKTPGAPSFLARHLSGIGAPGDPASNLQLASIGSIGFWLKTTTPDLQASPGLDDSTPGTERGFFKNVIPDGQWHKYEWFLDDVTHWDSFSAGNGRVASLFTTDSIQFTGTAATNLIFLDDIFYDPAAIAPNQWTLDASATWSNAGNWTGLIPNAVGATANLLRRATAPRTLTLSAPTTLGSLTFDNSFSYTLAGPSTLTLDVPSGNASLTVVNRGSHTISAPISFNDPTNISIDTAATLTLSGSLNNSSGKSLTKTGPGDLIITGPQTHGTGASLTINQGRVTFSSNAGSPAAPRLSITLNGSSLLSLNTTQNLTALTLNNNSLATLQPGANKTLKTNSLTLSSLATLDLADNDAVIQATAASRESVLSDITSHLASARNSLAGRWRGPGITSSTAASDPLRITTLAAILNDDGAGSPLYSTFAGQSVDLNSILLKFTYTGDSDLDGDIDADDYAHIDSGYAQWISDQSLPPTYASGDYDFSGAINSDDFFLIDRAFSSQSTPLSALSAAALSSVPEPSFLLPVTLAALLLQTRRRHP
ncbi:MAG TPA: family 10 glycosylhydrolase [Tepidisphaeraceae bacterium]|nr:family 10 glycosylhydrolase [Tepidisphaeraceae bacterium]